MHSPLTMYSPLTVIIPFLNEGGEVENTVKSTRETNREYIEIILINDCSSDGYDYERVATIYNTQYIVNPQRMGVAKSREIGVSLIKTPFFILLDAHMRFYKENWCDILVSYLEKEDRALYCLACKAIDKSGEPINNLIGCGAKLFLYGNDFSKILQPEWITEEIPYQEKDIEEIPCILGAAYAMSSRYWNYLKGLSMLKYYGADEAYLSLKVWLEGGRCILIKNTITGHIFRTGTQTPYAMYWPHLFFNKLIISETVLPEDYKRYVHAKLMALNPEAYMTAYAELIKVKDDIVNLRSYYQAIFTKNFDFFKQINQKYIDSENTDIPSIKINEEDGIRKVLKSVYDYLIKNNSSTIGFGVGGLGEIMYMAEYASIYAKDELPKVKKLLDELLENSKLEQFDFETGLSGLAWGLNYLNRHFHAFDIDEQFKESDKLLCHVLYDKIQKQDFAIPGGALGISFPFMERKNNKTLNDTIDILLRYINVYIFRYKDRIPRFTLFEITYFLILARDKNFCISDSLHLVSQVLSDSDKTDYLSECISAYLMIAINEKTENSSKDFHYNTLRKSAACREAVLAKVSEIGIYKGYPLLMYIFHAMYRKTQETVFRDALAYWKQETALKIASILLHTSVLSETEKSFLYGIAGAAFVILKTNQQ